MLPLRERTATVRCAGTREEGFSIDASATIATDAGEERPVERSERTGSLAGRTAIVTGGGTGVGEAIAFDLASRGARVCVTGRTPEPLERVAARHEGIEWRSCDATDIGATRALVGELRPDIAIANAGIAMSAPFPSTTPEAMREMFEINVMGVHALFQATLDALDEGAGARLVAIASTAGLKGYPYVSGYAATKHAVIGLVRSLALELAGREATRGVTVNAVCPGYTDTPMLRRTIENIMEKTGRKREAAEAPLLANNPQGRFVRPTEVTDAVLWLVGSGASAVTGQAISISGGEVTG